MLRVQPEKTLRGPLSPRARGADGSRPSTAFPYRPGEVFEGVVVRSLDRGRILVSTARGCFEALAHRRVQENSLYRFRVLGVGRSVRLEVVEGSGEAPGRGSIPGALGSGGSLRFRTALSTLLEGLSGGRARPEDSCHQDLWRLFPFFARPAGASAGAQGMQFVWRGFPWEASLLGAFLGGEGGLVESVHFQQVKKALLRVIGSLERSKGTGAAKLRSAAEEALWALQDQDDRLAAALGKWGWWWLLSFQADRDFQGAEALVGKGGSKETFRLVLSSHWTSLGELDAWFFLEKRNLQLRLKVSEGPAQVLVAEQLPNLRQGLAEAGLVVDSIRCEAIHPGDGGRGEEDPPFFGLASLDLTI